METDLDRTVRTVRADQADQPAPYDAVVVGGGPAGLSAALMLARSRRRVVVVDAGEPRNAPAAGVHGFLGHDGVAPVELTRIGRAEVESYGGSVLEGRVEGLAGERGDFRVRLEDGSMLAARRLVLATGLVDGLPAIEGIAQRWGRDVLHCPYCHGWEVRDQRIVVLAHPAMPTHQAQLFRQLSSTVMLVVDEGVELGEEDRSGLAGRGIAVVEGRATRLVVEDDRLTGLELADGRVLALDALVVATRLEARTELARALGAEVAETPLGDHLAVDAFGATSVPGLWSAGNVALLSAQVGSAVAAGAWAGAMLNADLVGEEVAAAR